MARITIQMGHCFRKSGSTGGRGEQILAEQVGKRLEAMLEAVGHDVIRLGADQAVPNNRDLFIALHSDGSTDPSRHGASVGYPDDGRSYRMAAAWKRAHERAGYRWGFQRDNYTNNLRYYYGFRDAEGYKFRFLAEHGMHSNPEEYGWMHADYDRLARAHFAAIGEMLGHPKPVVSPGPIVPMPPTDPTPTSQAVSTTINPDGRIWTFSRDGGVFTEGGAAFLGTPPAGHRPIVAGRATPGNGYALVGDDGGYFNFGDAPFCGSLGGIVLNAPVMDFVMTPSGNGYMMVAADGGVFCFGDAGYHGNGVISGLHDMIVGAALTPTGHGYWLLARNGGVHARGDAGFFGSLPGLGITPNKPAEALVPMPDGSGYLVVCGDGGIFGFGSAPAIQPHAPLMQEVYAGVRYVEDADWYDPGRVLVEMSNLGERYLLA